MEEQIRQIVYQAYQDRDPAVKSREFWLYVNPVYWVRRALECFLWKIMNLGPDNVKFDNFMYKIIRKVGGDWA